MKPLLTTIVLTSFVGIAIFGVFGMHTGVQNHDGGCIAATAQGMDCPKQSNPADRLAFHMDVLKDFSTATFGDMGVLLLILALLLVVGIASGALRNVITPPALAHRQFQQSDSSSPPALRKLIRWLALHENSPSVS